MVLIPSKPEDNHVYTETIEGTLCLMVDREVLAEVIINFRGEWVIRPKPTCAGRGVIVRPLPDPIPQFED